MEQVARALFVYAFLLLLFRMLGKRSLGQITTFDFILLLIISETTQGALVGNDGSATTMVVLVVTLVGTDLLLALLKARLPGLDRWLEGAPLVVVERGRLLEERMRLARLDAGDVLSSARTTQGLGSIEEIEYAVLEKNGAISIIPRRTSGG